MRVVIAVIQFDDLFKRCFGIAQVTASKMSTTEIVESVRVFRRNLDRPVQFRNCLVKIPKPNVGQPEVVMRIGLAIVEFNRVLKTLDRGRHLSDPRQHHAIVVVRLGTVWN